MRILFALFFINKFWRHMDTVGKHSVTLNLGRQV